MAGIRSLSRSAHSKALDRLHQQHSRLTLVIHRRMIGSVHLEKVMTTPLQFPDLVVGHIRDHLQQFWVFAKELIAGVGATLVLEILVLSVYTLLHPFTQQTLWVLGKKWIPATTPQYLDHVPTFSAEGSFQLLNDFAIPTHRAIKSLEITVDHEDQVVQLLTSC